MIWGLASQVPSQFYKIRNISVFPFSCKFQMISNCSLNKLIKLIELSIFSFQASQRRLVVASCSMMIHLDIRRNTAASRLFSLCFGCSLLPFTFFTPWRSSLPGAKGRYIRSFQGNVNIPVRPFTALQASGRGLSKGLRVFAGFLPLLLPFHPTVPLSSPFFPFPLLLYTLPFPLLTLHPSSLRSNQNGIYHIRLR